MIHLTKAINKDSNIFIGGDTHEGTVLKYRKGFKELIYCVNSHKNNHFIHVGDVAEGITIDDKRYQEEIQDSSRGVPLMQYQNATNELRDMKEKIIVILEGNHDWKLHKYGHFIRDTVCKELNVPYGTFEAVITFVDSVTGRKLFNLFVEHGQKTLNCKNHDPATKLHSLRKKLIDNLYEKAGDCEVMVCGHAHKIVIAPPTPEMYLTSEDGDLKHCYTKINGDGFIPYNLRWYGCSGSFLKMYEEGISAYGSLMGLAPTELGCLLLNIRDGRVSSLDPFYL